MVHKTKHNHPEEETRRCKNSYPQPEDARSASADQRLCVCMRMLVPEYVLLNPSYISIEKSHGVHIPECEQ